MSIRKVISCDQCQKELVTDWEQGRIRHVSATMHTHPTQTILVQTQNFDLCDACLLYFVAERLKPGPA